MIVDIVRWVCLLFLLAVFLRMILSFIPLGYDTPLEGVNRGLVKATEPVLAPVRRFVRPASLGGTAMDLSPLVVCVVIIIILGLL